jgi:hypothetical protein
MSAADLSNTVNLADLKALLAVADFGQPGGSQAQSHPAAAAVSNS